LFYINIKADSTICFINICRLKFPMVFVWTILNQLFFSDSWISFYFGCKVFFTVLNYKLFVIFFSVLYFIRIVTMHNLYWLVIGNSIFCYMFWRKLVAWYFACICILLYCFFHLLVMYWFSLLLVKSHCLVLWALRRYVTALGRRWLKVVLEFICLVKVVDLLSLLICRFNWP